MKLSDIPPELSAEYHLLDYVKEGLIYFEIRKGVYGLPQAGILANKLLESRFDAAGYYQEETTPGL